jgi:hypothetical protein
MGLMDVHRHPLLLLLQALLLLLLPAPHPQQQQLLLLVPQHPLALNPAAAAAV